MEPLGSYPRIWNPGKPLSLTQDPGTHTVLPEIPISARTATKPWRLKKANQALAQPQASITL